MSDYLKEDGAFHATPDAACARCKKAASLKTRTEHLCQACFEGLVIGKAMKRIDPLNNRRLSGLEQCNLLLPMSFGPSSLALFYLLDKRLNRQRQSQGPRSFRLLVYHVRSATEGDEVSGLEKLQTLHKHYPDHDYLSTPLESVLFSQCPGETTPLSFENGLRGQPGHENGLGLAELMPIQRSEYLKSGMINAVRTRLILATAQAHGCDCVAWSSSATRLAEKALTEVANGRGLGVPFHLCNDTTLHGLRMTYPMRDLLQKEIVHFIDMAVPDPIARLSTDAFATDTRNAAKATIGGLMHDYILSAEGSYPSIVANVVKTTGRLVSPVGTKDGGFCQLCALPLPSHLASEASTEATRLSERSSSISNCPHACPSCSDCFGNSVCSLAIVRENEKIGSS